MRTSRNALSTLAALALLVAPAAASAQRYAPPPPRYDYGPQRSPWYVGFGIGSGNGSYVIDGERVNFLQHHGGYSATNAAFQLELGATLSPWLLLGGEVSGLVSDANHIDSTLSVGQLLAVATWFPAQRGLFFRGGAGLAWISEEVADVDGFLHRNEATGVGLMGGVGYAWWLGRRFNLTLHGDVNLHAYGDDHGTLPSSSATFTGFLGFAWY